MGRAETIGDRGVGGNVEHEAGAVTRLHGPLAVAGEPAEGRHQHPPFVNGHAVQVPAVSGSRWRPAPDDNALRVDPENRISERGHGNQKLPVPGEVVWVGEPRHRESAVEPACPVEQELPGRGRLGRIEPGARNAASGRGEPTGRKTVDLLDVIAGEQEEPFVQARHRYLHRAILTERLR